MTILTNNLSGIFNSMALKKTKELISGSGDDMGLYLKHFIAKYLGDKPDAVEKSTSILFPTNYNNIEGVIYKMQDESGFVSGLRIDLQKSQKHGNYTYATIQVQYGSGSNFPKGGAYSGALIRTDCEFEVNDINNALRKSFETRSYWRIDPS